MAINNGVDNSSRGRVTARLSAEKQEILQLAADLSGSTLNQFIVQSALRAAEQVIEQEEVIRSIRLTMDESRRFFALLDEPPKPNEALQRAMARFRNKQRGNANSTTQGERRP
ncbi:DUF1778 domain-containing protein [Burkholderia multivorans]|jgi:uncharacterized protein (DUF1778 family)|uniref:DUF1778 domain-containing protein n=1 Tax=Burkholderia vietnamiensis (strain G4 / LMG 22486) TaxID=269482 RepID=A4JRY5_BURVG|nr:MULTISPECIES: DUF1778 domain-containing protein [Burkholderia cepacia complex]ABO59038.1 conserved hypothetical protein [Burkholderia vietnamiensis G4]AYY99595.1 DUF1778 domain-containing protein [Burkholderia multivorans]MBJ9619659.1 DUF1778 domain-containing protein [Burkholderia multivorans]MBR7974416.1 DUF1778 domain-containing protein [Burkholderia vietnamiensis]MBR8036739.1 DUF1778 domain-containing protein [Burkholderia vietnamiensis]